jgi:hypothetical protein
MSSNRPEDQMSTLLLERVARSVSPADRLRRLHRTRRRERVLAIAAGVASLAAVITLPLLWLGRGGAPTGTTTPVITSTGATPDYSIECTLEVRFDADTTISRSTIIPPSLGATRTISIPPYRLALTIEASTYEQGGMDLRMELFEEAADGTLQPLDVSAAGDLPILAHPGDPLLALGPVWVNVNRLTPTCAVAG